MHEIVLKDVSLKIKDKNILTNISLEMVSGNIYGLYGRNGSGKTMLMKCILGLIKATSGTVTCDDMVVGKNMDFMPDAGFLIEEPEFYGNYSARQNLGLLAGIKSHISKKEIDEAIGLVGLDADNRLKVRKYSLGMRKRLGIAQAIMENPGILILDEPTSALDEEGVKWFREFLRNEREKGKLIIISSHIKDDIFGLCDEIYTMEKGSIKNAASLYIA